MSQQHPDNSETGHSEKKRNAPPVPPLPAESGLRFTVPTPEIDGFHDIEKIGEGGMGIVFRARQISPPRLVAIKLMKGVPIGDKKPAERFRREIEIVSRLEHPNIVRVYSVGSALGRPYFVMELVETGSLNERLHSKCTTQREAIEIVLTLAQTLQYTHSKRVVHRDLKPANILFGSDGAVKIVDFGIACSVDDITHTVTEGPLGTWQYMAPEQLSGRSRDVGPSADIYALGVILFELLTDVRPFAADNIAALANSVSHDTPSSPSKLIANQTAAGINFKDLDTICLRMLETLPQDRPTASHVAVDLKHLLNCEPISMRRLSTLEQVIRYTTRYPARVFSMFAAAVVAVLLAVVSVGYSHNAELEESRKLLRRTAYVADMHHVSRDWNAGNVLGMISRLRRWSESKELHGPVWNYYQNMLSSPLLTIEAHDGSVSAIDLNSNQTMLASGGEDGRIKLWNAESGKLIREFGFDVGSKGPRGLYRQVEDMSFSPDGKSLAVAGHQNAIWIWNVATGKLQATIRPDPRSALANVNAIVHSKDGETLYSVGSLGNIDAWSTSSHQKLYSMKSKLVFPKLLEINSDGSKLATAPKGLEVWNMKERTVEFLNKPKNVWMSDHNISSMCFSPDSTELMTTTEDGFVDRVELSTGNRTHSKVRGELSCNAIDWSQQNDLIAVAGMSGKTHVINLPKPGVQQHSIAQFQGHEGTVNDIVTWDDGSKLASGGSDGKILVWNRNQEQLSQTLRSDCLATRLAVHPTERLVAGVSPDTWQKDSGTNDLIWVWNESTEKSVIETKLKSTLINRLDNVAWCGNSIIAGGQGGDVAIWNYRENDAVVFANLPSRIDGLAGSDDGKIAAAMALDSCHVWNTKSKSLLWKKNRKPQARNFTNNLGTLAIDSVRNRIACGLSNGKIEIHKLKTGKLVRELSDLVAPVTQVAFSSDGQRVAGADERGNIAIWDLLSEKNAVVLDVFHGIPVASLAFSNDSKYLAAQALKPRYGGTSPIKLIDIRTSLVIAEMTVDFSTTSCVQFSNNDLRLIAIAGNDLRCLDLSSGESAKKFQ